eukprot:363882-Chlamydomonas_euryale.AAC.1
MLDTGLPAQSSHDPRVRLAHALEASGSAPASASQQGCLEFKLIRISVIPASSKIEIDRSRACTLPPLSRSSHT